MSIFSLNHKSDQLAQFYLSQLKIGRENPSLAYLNQLITAHQEKVPFENYTRIIDFHHVEGHLPSIDAYIERLHRGAGGVCWTLARGFGWLLKNLGFEVEYLYMHPGHVCLHVKLDQDYYVDVGYGAPMFEAKLLRSSFEIVKPWETFLYEVNSDSVQVRRTPGPEKVLSLQPIEANEIESHFKAGNVWGRNRFLSLLIISKFENGKLVRIINKKLQDYRLATPVEKELDENELRQALKNIFDIDLSYYEKASGYLLR